jgi:hypothetical protein
MKTTMFVAVAFACGFGVSYLFFGRTVERNNPIDHAPAISKEKDESAPKKPSLVAAKSFPNLPKRHLAVTLPDVIPEFLAPFGPSPGDHLNIIAVHEPPDGDKSYSKILVNDVTLLEIEHSTVVDETGLTARPKIVAIVAVPTDEVPYVELAMQRGRLALSRRAFRDSSLQPAPATNEGEPPLTSGAQQADKEPKSVRIPNPKVVIGGSTIQIGTHPRELAALGPAVSFASVSSGASGSGRWRDENLKLEIEVRFSNWRVTEICIADSVARRNSLPPVSAEELRSGLKQNAPEGPVIINSPVPVIINSR